MARIALFMPKGVVAAVFGALLLSACGGSDPLAFGGGGDLPPLREETLDAELQPLMTQTTLRGCDFMNPDYCQFPWPSDYFTTEDATSPTGRRVDLNLLGMPMNLVGLPIRPDEWNRNDGFSPGQLIVTHVPGLDPAVSGIADVTDIEASLEDDAPIFVIDADTGERHPIWAEIDASETAGSLCDAPGTAADLVNLVAGEAGLDDLLENLDGVVGTVTDGLDQGCTLTLQPILAALGEALSASGIEPNSAFKVDPPALLMRPGDQLQGRPPLYRGDARSARRRGQPAGGAAGLPRLPRPSPQRTGAGERPPRAHGVAVRHACRQRRGAG